MEQVPGGNAMRRPQLSLRPPVPPCPHITAKRDKGACLPPNVCRMMGAPRRHERVPRPTSLAQLEVFHVGPNVLANRSAPRKCGARAPSRCCSARKLRPSIQLQTKLPEKSLYFYFASKFSPICVKELLSKVALGTEDRTCCQSHAAGTVGRSQVLEVQPHPVEKSGSDYPSVCAKVNKNLVKRGVWSGFQRNGDALNTGTHGHTTIDVVEGALTRAGEGWNGTGSSRFGSGRYSSCDPLPEIHPGSHREQDDREDPKGRIAHSSFLGHRTQS
jgi:hypothetical protein